MVSKRNKYSLDPDDWSKQRALGHEMLDDMMTRLETIRDHDFHWPSEKEVKELMLPLPEKGTGERETYQIFKENILNFSLTHIKPNFWGVVAGTGSPYGMLVEMLVGGVNNLMAAKPGIGGYIHEQVIEWIKELLEYPAEAGGILVNGGSEANFTALAVARNAKAARDMKKEGVHGQPQRMVLYCSDQAHECIERSVELLGLGNEALRWIPTNNDHSMNLNKLIKQIKQDRYSGYHPFCVIGTAGTTNNGAFDDFKALREIANQENMWFHVDGAFGSWLKLSVTHKHLSDGIELADSLAVDLHKWISMPYGIGCTLVRDKKAHFKTFVYGHEAEYIKSGQDLGDDQITSPHNLALALSRNNLNLKAYMLLRAYGREMYSGLVQQNLDQIKYFSGLIEANSSLELMAPVISNVVCFRYNPGGLGKEYLDSLNQGILQKIWEINFWIISDTHVKDQYMLRVCNVNNRTTKSDFDELVSDILRIGEQLMNTGE